MDLYSIIVHLYLLVLDLDVMYVRGILNQSSSSPQSMSLTVQPIVI